MEFHHELQLLQVKSVVIGSDHMLIQLRRAVADLTLEKIILAEAAKGNF